MNLISFYNEVTHLADQGKPVDVVLLISAKLLILLLAHRSGSKGYSKCGF